MKFVPVAIWLNESFKAQKQQLQCVQYSICVFSMLSPGLIVISHLVVTDLFVHSLSGMMLLYLAEPLFILKCFCISKIYTLISVRISH